jgi:hypothetical protein
VITFRKACLLLLVFLSLGVCLWLKWLTHSPFPWEDSNNSPTGAGGDPSGRGASLEARETAADETVWSQEMLAQRCGRTFESLWDSINGATNKLNVIAAFATGEIALGKWGTPQALPHAIELREPTGPGPALSAAQWRPWVENFASDGWQLENIEFRHSRFDTDGQGQPRQSHFYFAARLNHSKRPERAVVEGDLIVDWAAKRPGDKFPPVKRIDASHLNVKTRTGEPPFQLILRQDIAPPERSTYIDPLIVYDLDNDGLPEIILAGKNLVYRRRGEDRYEAEPLCRYPPESLTSAVIADFDGDGFADFLCANSRGLFFFKGSPEGTFDEPGRLAWPASPPLKNTMALTCGDVDHDGDMDVFLGQYRVPTLGQVLRPYYYDANDGLPAYLLQNDGHANFTDVTDAAGLGAKRWRRIYSASLADLNDDGHLDLVVVSDFAGLDLYQNDGSGHFSDVTRQWVAEPHAFGMAHALADFNADGRLDLLMIGMPSPTVDRLEHLGLRRFYSAEDPVRRPAMTFGNRLYLGRVDGGFKQTSLNDSIARSGWSWGCSAFDFDNDGFPDVYIANGLESKQSVRDYESEFWLHDIFLDETIDDVAATIYLMGKFSRTRGSGWSYGGYEKNRLYLNQRGESFLEIGHLAGVTLEQDSRNVVATDLDGDGRVDLLVTTFEVWPQVKQTLQVYKNGLNDAGHWIGFRFRKEGPGKSPVGAQVTIHYQGHKMTRQIVTGDSHRSQHANTVHFGLGAAERVELVEIRWLNGPALTLSQLAADRYYEIHAPATQSRIPK